MVKLVYLYNFDTCTFTRYIAAGIIAGNKTTVGTKGNEFKSNNLKDIIFIEKIFPNEISIGPRLPIRTDHPVHVDSSRTGTDRPSRTVDL